MMDVAWGGGYSKGHEPPETVVLWFCVVYLIHSHLETKQFQSQQVGQFKGFPQNVWLGSENYKNNIN